MMAIMRQFRELKNQSGIKEFAPQNDVSRSMVQKQLTLGIPAP